MQLNFITDKHFLFFDNFSETCINIKHTDFQHLTTENEMRQERTKLQTPNTRLCSLAG